MTDLQFPANGWSMQRKIRFATVAFTRPFHFEGLDKACLSEGSRFSKIYSLLLLNEILRRLSAPQDDDNYGAISSTPHSDIILYPICLLHATFLPSRDVSIETSKVLRRLFP